MKACLSVLGSLLVLITCSASLWGYSPSQSHATLKVKNKHLIFTLEVPSSIAEGVKKEFPDC